MSNYKLNIGNEFDVCVEVPSTLKEFEELALKLIESPVNQLLNVGFDELVKICKRNGWDPSVEGLGEYTSKIAGDGIGTSRNLYESKDFVGLLDAYGKAKQLEDRAPLVVLRDGETGEVLEPSMETYFKILAAPEAQVFMQAIMEEDE